MKKILIAIACLCAAAGLWAQENYVPSPENLASRKAFEEARFGIFIHWGVYSMVGHGEWVMSNLKLKQDEYSRLAGGFNPSKFNADEWVSAIKASGAKYITITSRHHDGFSMFKTAASPYNIVDATPFKRDVLAELSEACAREGIKLSFYYSHLDWGRNDYWPLGRTGHYAGRPEGGPDDWKHYLSFVNAQLTELLTQYGPVGAIWFDGVWEKDMFPREEQPAIWNLYGQYELIHKLQPGCLVGNNHHLVPFPGEDIQIFERDIPGHSEVGYSDNQGISETLPLETCQTMNGSWGYDITDTKYKSVDYLIQYLVRTAGKGANLLLNIGPRPDGTLPDEALERLAGMGEWLKVYGETIYGTKAGLVPEQDWGVSTQKGKTLYAHILKPAASILLPMPGVAVKSAVAFAYGSPVSFEKCKAGVVLTLPENVPGPDFVVALELGKSQK